MVTGMGEVCDDINCMSPGHVMKMISVDLISTCSLPRQWADAVLNHTFVECKEL